MAAGLWWRSPHFAWGGGSFGACRACCPPAPSSGESWSEAPKDGGESKRWTERGMTEETCEILKTSQRSGVWRIVWFPKDGNSICQCFSSSPVFPLIDLFWWLVQLMQSTHQASLIPSFPCRHLVLAKGKRADSLRNSPEYSEALQSFFGQKKRTDNRGCLHFVIRSDWSC